MTNLLEETLERLNGIGKTVTDIVWIGSRDGTLIIPLSKFETVFNVNYDSGYGAQEIADDLVIVGKDWWMERYEYDGSESWVFKQMPVISPTPKPVNKVKGGMWYSLDKITSKS